MTRNTSQAIAGLSRRRWLGLALASGAALAAGAALWSAPATPSRTATPALLAFDAAHAAILTALAEAVLPTGDGFPTPAQAEVLPRLDEEVYFVSEDVRADIRTAVQALEYLPFLYGHVSRFSRLDLHERRQVLTKGSCSRLDVPRAVCTNLRMLVQLVYFGHAATWPRIGYEGPFAGLEPSRSEQRRHYATLTRVEVRSDTTGVRP